MARGSYIWNERSSFVNPYNFVSSDFSQKTKADLKKEKYTGVDSAWEDELSHAVKKYSATISVK